MAGASADSALVAESLALLRELAAGVAPLGAVADEIEASRGSPLVAGLDGAERGAVLERLTGGAIGSKRPPGAAAVRIRRGETMRFRARRAGGDDEVCAMPGPGGAANDRAAEAARAEERLPALVRRPPPRWKLWLWPVRWWQARRARRAIAEWERARAALAEAERATSAVAAERARFVERLRLLASGLGEGAAVREIVVEVAGGGVPDGIELLELNGMSRAGARVDGVIALPEGAGLASAELAALPALLRDARALRLAGRAVDAITAALLRLDDTLDTAEARFAARIERLEARRVADPEAVIAEHLARVRPQAAAGISAVLEHTTAHLGTELAELAAGWIRAVEAVSSGDQLAAATAAIEAEMGPAVEQAVAAARLLAMGGIGGVVHDLTPALLQAAGVAADAAPASALEPVAMLEALAASRGTTLSGGRLSRLFRSLDARKAELLGKVQERAARLQALASADLLGAEPRLRAAVEAALEGALAGALARREERLDDELADERAAIAAERVPLAPLAAARDTARAGARRLRAAIEELAAASPDAAAAARAAL